MVQAARSGRQNIAEGSRAAAASSQTELRLVNVARASLDELLLDYEDFLRQRGQRQWTKDDPEALAVRQVARSLPRGGDPSNPPDPSDLIKRYRPWLNHSDPAVVANALLCLIHQTNYLLDQQIAALERAFVERGGYTEQLATVRLARRRSEEAARAPDATDSSPSPSCPRCGKLMVVRTARQGANAGSQFWGCSAYPECNGTRPLDESARSVRSRRTGRSQPKP